MKEFNKQQMLRYNRQIVLPQVDVEGQEGLFNSSALIIGLGGLGCASAQYLVAAGIGQITLVDDDAVELSNLQRQVLHSENDIGKNKAESARESLQKINSDVQYQTLPCRLHYEALSKQVHQHDVVLDCTDNLQSRNLINQVCWEQKTPMVMASAIRLEGQLMVVNPKVGSGCYACVSRFISDQELSCIESGILSPVVGVIGTYQALLALKILVGIGDSTVGQLHHFDAITMSWNTLTVQPNPDCAICAN